MVIIEVIDAIIDSISGIVCGVLIAVVIHTFFNKKNGGFVPICIVSSGICCLLIFLSHFLDSFLWVEEVRLFMIVLFLCILFGNIAGCVFFSLISAIFNTNKQTEDIINKICLIIGTLAGVIVAIIFATTNII